jgi:hypothetical protein
VPQGRFRQADQELVHQGPQGHIRVARLIDRKEDRMTPKSSYTVLGWIVWQIGSRLAKRKATQNKGKLGAGAAVALIVIGGILVAAGDSDD